MNQGDVVYHTPRGILSRVGLDYGYPLIIFVSRNFDVMDGHMDACTKNNVVKDALMSSGTLNHLLLYVYTFDSVTLSS